MTENEGLRMQMSQAVADFESDAEWVARSIEVTDEIQAWLENDSC